MRFRRHLTQSFTQTGSKLKNAPFSVGSKIQNALPSRHTYTGLTSRQPSSDTADVRFHNPVQISFGENIYRKTLGEIIGTEPKRLGLFYGRRAMKARGSVDTIKAQLSHCEVVDVGGIAPNPEIRDVEDVLKSLPKLDLIIGIGGGSVLDTAKAAAFLAASGGELAPVLRRKCQRDPRAEVPMIAIPTTHGTGSEVTPWATIWDREERKKYSLSSKRLYPQHAIVDSTLTQSLPKPETASSSFDALSHAFEALWSLRANPVSDLYAMESISLIMKNLPLVMHDLDNVHWRGCLAKASLLAGLAFSNTKTAAVHAVSYPMTLHFDIPHGVACALTLAEFWLFNCPAMNRDKVQTLLESLGYADPHELYLALKELSLSVGLPTTLSEAGIPASGMKVILREGFHPERIHNNVREVTRDSLQAILNKIAN